MARPRCSRKEPKIRRSITDMEREASIMTRVLVDELCAQVDLSVASATAIAIAVWLPFFRKSLRVNSDTYMPLVVCPSANVNPDLLRATGCTRPPSSNSRLKCLCRSQLLHGCRRANCWQSCSTESGRDVSRAQVVYQMSETELRAELQDARIVG